MNREVTENHTLNYTLGVIIKHTERRSHKSRYDLSSVAQLFFVLLSNVVCVDIHHLDDILMSHPQAVSISPPLSLFLSLPHVGHHFINKTPTSLSKHAPACHGDRWPTHTHRRAHTHTGTGDLCGMLHAHRQKPPTGFCAHSPNECTRIHL